MSILPKGDTASQKKGKLAEMTPSLFGRVRWTVVKYAPVCHGSWSAIGFACLLSKVWEP